MALIAGFVVILWYDRQGRLIPGTGAKVGSKTWHKGMQEVEKLLSDRKYKIVKQEHTPKKKFWVSTVWLGLDHSLMPGTPLIFETMVFEAKKRRRKAYTSKDGKLKIPAYSYQEDYDSRRYSTEKEALKGHAELLKGYTRLEELGESFT